MRFIEDTTNGRFANITNPDRFKQNEEVIVFTRKEFNWVYRSMMNPTNYNNDFSFYWIQQNMKINGLLAPRKNGMCMYH